MKLVKYIVGWIEDGDVIDGDHDAYKTEQEAVEAFKDFVDDATSFNVAWIGREGCPWKTEEDARKGTEVFFYVKKVTLEINDDLKDSKVAFWDAEADWDWEYLIAPNLGEQR